MTLSVRYSNSPDDTNGERVIYLDQRFYEAIYRNCRSAEGPFPVLRTLALTRYKSNYPYFSVEQMPGAIAELELLESSGISHPQIADFKSVCGKALERGCGLYVTGDMYPELWKTEP
jgi:hypothetical protein